MAAVRKGNEYQIVRDAERLVFRRPIGPRLLCGMGAVMFLGVTLFFVVVIPFVAFGPHSYPPGAFIMLGMALFMAVFGLGFLYLTGPCELSFDLRQRTYRFLRGVPLLPRVTEGKIEEFDYLYTRGIYYYAYAMTDARIYLVWKTPAKILGFLPQ